MKKVEYQEQKKLLLRQIGKYATAAGAVMLTGNLANAAVHLTTTTINLTPGYHGIDFDGNGQDEIYFSVFTSSSNSTVSMYAYIGSDPNATTVDAIQSGPFAPFDSVDPAALPFNHLIGPTLPFTSAWAGLSGQTIISTGDGSNTSGNFGSYPGETRYMGVRFSGDGGSTWHYGWVGIHCNNLPLYGTGTVGSVINFAYETTPETPITAGSGAAAVPLLPLASALGLGLAGLFGFMRNRRKKAIVE
jgi:hypothetical protein